MYITIARVYATDFSMMYQHLQYVPVSKIYLPDFCQIPTTLQYRDDRKPPLYSLEMTENHHFGGIF
jgi:hypothetical protein